VQQFALLAVCITIGGSTVGCAASIEELTAEARECVDQSTNLSGVIEATEEQRTVCWKPVNDKIEALAKAEKRRKERRGPSCGNGLVAWGNDWDGYACITHAQVRENLRRMGL